MNCFSARRGGRRAGWARAAAIGVALIGAPFVARAQTDGTCVPMAERAGRELGCFITAREELGRLDSSPPLYWHLDTYPTRPRGGHRVARIGPLPLVAADSFAAVYMEGVFAPGMQTVVHRHPGVEAWYTLEGSMCLETPQGKLQQHARGPGVLVRGGEPMMLTGTGRATRRSVVLILQDATKPRSTPAHDWTPRQLCGSAAG